MTIKKKIDSSADAMKYITRGADVKEDASLEERKSLCLGIPKAFLVEIDEVVKKRVGLSRNAWILEALQEKMEKDSNE